MSAENFETPEGSARYEYDAKTRTVYEVASGTETGATGRVERRIACKLETDEQLKTFARLIAVRLAAREQLEAFDAVLARKRTELNRAEDALQRGQRAQHPCTYDVGI